MGSSGALSSKTQANWLPLGVWQTSRRTDGRVKPWRVAAWIVVAAMALARIAYLLYACPYDLSPDEAHYWDWSRHLDWSYYSKGPGVAWLIAASTAVFGHAMWSVRLPAVLCGSLTLLGLFELTQRVYRQPSLAFAVLLLASSLPVLAAGALLMTIDAPYVCLWTWALVAAHRACFDETASVRGRGALWFLTGWLVGLGILFKYTMILFLPSLLAFLAVPFRGVTRPVHLGRLVVFAGAFLLPVVACSLPIVLWNARHGWLTFLHVGRQAGMQSGAIEWLGPVHYLAGQAGVLLGFWFVFLAAAAVAAGRHFVRWAVHTRDAAEPAAQESRTDSSPAGWLPPEQIWFLLSFSLPTFLVFLGFSVKTRVELNWPATAYVSAGVLAAGWIAAQRRSPVTAWRRWSQGVLVVAVLTSLAVTLLMHRTEVVYGLWPVRGTQPEAVRSGPRRWDPTCRLRGWQELAGEVERIRQRLRQQGIEPVLAADGWALPGELAFYLPDRPEVYCLGPANGGRLSQYDLWRPNPVWDPQPFLGRTFLCVGPLSPQARRGFARTEATVWVVHSVAGHPVAAWPITVAHDFRGFPSVAPRGY
jgi:4-amino-4-deoxy-L-arabinose transferase-like glycosyltransferase